MKRKTNINFDKKYHLILKECDKKTCFWYNKRAVFNCDSPDRRTCLKNNCNKFEVMK